MGEPSLWPRIRGELAAAAPRREELADVAMGPGRRGRDRAGGSVVAAVDGPPAHAGDFLTEEALRDVQQAEAAYARSIEKLSSVAGAGLQSPSPLAAAYREKLLVLDSAIADLKANVENNRYNVYLQTQLASLYREKQKTLQEWLENAKRN